MNEFDAVKSKIDKFKFTSHFSFEPESFGYLVNSCDFFVFAYGEVWNLEANILAKELHFEDIVNNEDIIDYRVIQSTKLLVLDSQSIIRLFDLKSMTCLKTFGVPEYSENGDDLTTLEMVTDSQVAVLINESIKVYDIDKACLVKTMELSFNAEDYFANRILAFLENRNELVLYQGFDDRFIVKLLDFHTSNVIRTYWINEKKFAAFLALPNGKFVYSFQNKAQIWDIDTARCVKRFACKGDIKKFLLTADKHGLIGCTSHGEIKVWDVTRQFKLIKTLKGAIVDEPGLMNMRLYADDKLIVLNDNEVRILDLITDECVRTLVLEKMKLFPKTLQMCSFF